MWAPGREEGRGTAVQLIKLDMGSFGGMLAILVKFKVLINCIWDSPCLKWVLMAYPEICPYRTNASCTCRFTVEYILSFSLPTLTSLMDIQAHTPLCACSGQRTVCGDVVLFFHHVGLQGLTLSSGLPVVRNSRSSRAQLEGNHTVESSREVSLFLSLHGLSNGSKINHFASPKNIFWPPNDTT